MTYRELLKEATRLKKEKRYDEACQTLRVAYQSADVNEVILIQERLRLPMYLLLAGKSNDGWAELNRLSSEYHEPYDLIPIRSQMRIFSEKEGRWNDAILYSAIVYTMVLKNKIHFIKSVHHQADVIAIEEPIKIETVERSFFEFDFRIIDADRKAFAYTENGNPIFDVAHNHMLESLNRMLDLDAIEREFEGLCRRIERPELPLAIAEKIIETVGYEDDNGEWVSDFHHFFRQQLMD
ncbi:hypothetical protein [Erwinia sp. LJJL01]|uniref:hypothetical protein n=1 Tax=Erwinia sp. LJJL01 TaxID=3391839 RepID=UPI00105CD1B2